MTKEKFQMLAEIVLIQQQTVCSLQRSFKSLYEAVAPLIPNDPKYLDTLAELERLEGIVDRIENERIPDYRAFFGLPPEQ